MPVPVLPSKIPDSKRRCEKALAGPKISPCPCMRHLEVGCRCSPSCSRRALDRVGVCSWGRWRLGVRGLGPSIAPLAMHASCAHVSLSVTTVHGVCVPVVVVTCLGSPPTLPLPSAFRHRGALEVVPCAGVLAPAKSPALVDALLFVLLKAGVLRQRRRRGHQRGHQRGGERHGQSFHLGSSAFGWEGRVRNLIYPPPPPPPPRQGAGCRSVGKARVS